MAFEHHQTSTPVSDSHKNGVGNGVNENVNLIPLKKPKVELAEPIPAIPVSSYKRFLYPNPQLSSSWSNLPQVPVHAINAAAMVKTEQNFGVRQFRAPVRMVHPRGRITATGTESNNNNTSTACLARPLSPPKPATKTGTGCNSERRFWKAGDYVGAPSDNLNWEAIARSDHIRVHPRFLHSNATSHRWVLGAFAELMDNALDEVRNGATFVNIDMIKNYKTGERMLVIEDDGGGMNPQRMRECMSLGYSSKSKMANTIGQYGNGFKTSTMRLGADVIVFSRFRGKDGNNSTQSIGLLSYTFLRCTKKEDIEVPMLDYERKGQSWERIVRVESVPDVWNNKMNTMVQWSPFSSEADLLEQFNDLKDHGTKIIIYNLWEDDAGGLELDFDSDPYDIRTRGRDESKILMAQQYPNSKHFLTYQHSLRSYASILYLKLPKNFRMILRGKDVDHHNIVDDLMMIQKVTYRPQQNPNAIGGSKDFRMVADVAVGFVKDAKYHIDVQGFNVYHKNRLIKPFWRVWHAAGSDGRGVIGVLEADFIEPAHDKQGFERTVVLTRLETKLKEMQKNYWSSRCHEIGYALRGKKRSGSERDEPSDQPESNHVPNSGNSNDLNVSTPVSGRMVSLPSNAVHPLSQNRNTGNQEVESRMTANKNVGNDHGKLHSQKLLPTTIVKQEDPSETEAHSSAVSVSRIVEHKFKATSMNNQGRNIVHSDMSFSPKNPIWKLSNKTLENPLPPFTRPMARENNNDQKPAEIKTNMGVVNTEAGRQRVSIIPDDIKKLREENQKLREEVRNLSERLKFEEGEILGDDPLKEELEAEKNKSKFLETQLLEATRKNEELKKEWETATKKVEELKKGLETLRNMH